MESKLSLLIYTATAQHRINRFKINHAPPTHGLMYVSLAEPILLRSLGENSFFVYSNYFLYYEKVILIFNSFFFVLSHYLGTSISFITYL
jgi:hypothetical protein